MLVVAGGADAALQLIASTEVNQIIWVKDQLRIFLYRCSITRLAQDGVRQIPCLDPDQEARESLWQVKFQFCYIWSLSSLFLLGFPGVVHFVGGAIGFSRLTSILSWDPVSGIISS